MSQNDTTTIGGRHIGVGTIPPTRALLVEVVIARVCGEGLFKAFTTAKDKAEMKAAAGAAIALMAGRLDAAELLETMKIVMEYVRIEGEPVKDIDVAFMGRNRELWQVFLFALRVNFHDFFPESLLASVRKTMEAASKESSPQT